MENQFGYFAEKPFSRDKYNEFVKDYSPEGMRGRLEALKDTVIGNVIASELNNLGLSFESAENIVEGMDSQTIEQMASLLSDIILSADSNDQASVKLAAKAFAQFVNQN